MIRSFLIHVQNYCDRYLRWNIPLNFDAWMRLIDQNTMTDHDEALFKKGLHDHPEWVNQADDSLQTPIMIASADGHLDVVKLLIDAGADLTLQDHKGWTALMGASSRGHFEIVQTIIQQGVALEILNQNQQTALDLAQKNGYDNVVACLKAHADQKALNQVIQPQNSSSHLSRLTKLEHLPAKTPRL